MYQNLVIVGHIGGEPQLHHTRAGQVVCNFSVATNRIWTNNRGQRQEETVWFWVATWGQLAETCHQYLKKGQQVFCEGRLTANRHSGGPAVRQDRAGNRRASYEMTAHEVKFLVGGN